MKRFVHRYRISKFKRFTNGLLFAMISLIALSLCLVGIYISGATQRDIILPFVIGMLSLFMGIVAMFHNSEPRKEDMSGISNR